MTKVIQGVALGNVTRRKTPAGDGFLPARYIEKGDQIEADRQDITRPQWLHLTKINDEPVDGDEWVSAGTTEQYISWDWVEIVEPPPPPVTTTPAPVPYTITLGDGIIYEKVTITGIVNPVSK